MLTISKMSLQPSTEKEMTQEEAIRVIQVAERARQGRMRSKLYEESREASLRSTNAGTESTELAAICIQKVINMQQTCFPCTGEPSYHA